MADSLVIANQIELLGGPGGSPSINPRCLGAIFQLLPGPGHGGGVSAGTFDLSAPQPTTDFVASLLTDGERPQGYRASNRTISLPIRITAPDFATLAGAREVLMQAVDQQFWQLTWTRDQGAESQLYPLVFDCFRAMPTTVLWGGPEGFDLHPMGIISVSFSALPYGRSDTQERMSFASPVPAAPPPPPAPVVLDAFSTINNPQCIQSTVCIVGPSTCFWDPGFSPAFDDDGHLTPLVYGQTLPNSVDLTAMVSLQMFLGLASKAFWHHHHDQGHTRVNLYFTLTDVSGNMLRFSRSNVRLPVSDTPGLPKFTRVTVGIPLPAENPNFAYTSVVAYSLTIVNRATPALRHIVAYLDALTAYPSTQTANPSTRGAIYQLYGVKGTARTPASLQFQAAPVAGSPSTFTTPTTSGLYTVPGGTVYLKVEAWGGGGAGGGRSTSGVGGGGGGGEYAQEPIFTASPGQVIPYVVGAAGIQGATPVDGQDTVFGPVPAGTQVINANGGSSALQNSITGGLGATGSTNLIHFPGGKGRDATGNVGGGGGSSAGPGGAGNTPTGTVNLVLTGSGNWTAPPGVTTVTVTAVGAGGGGGEGGVGNGAGGGGGESATQTFTVIPGNSYAYVSGTGGVGGAGDTLPGSDGTDTTFVVGAVTLRAHGGKAGPASSHTVSGGLGGSGSTAPIHFNGGQGGATGPYPGSGASSAGTSAAGNNGSPYSSAGAIAPAGGGNGGFSSGPAANNAGPGAVPGGGGGGTWSAGHAGGAGGNGNLTLVFPGGAPTNNGGVAPAGGGTGGAGGPSANTVGSAGSTPGGGGGGANSTGTAEAGGGGGTGKLVITPYASPAFKTLIVHRPKHGCHPAYMPMVSVGNGADIPNGGTDYTVPVPQSGVNASFDGTYTAVLIASSFNSPTNARTITVTVEQNEAPSGATYLSSTSVTVSPGVASLTGPGNQVNNGVLVVGTLTLPVKALAADNTSAFFQVRVTDTNTADRFYDLLLLDTQGQTLIINEPTSGYINYYLDEPQPLYDLGLYLGSQLGRPNAVSVVDAVQAVSGGPFMLDPRECILFAYSVDGLAPAIGVTYYDRYFFDHISN